MICFYLLWTLCYLLLLAWMFEKWPGRSVEIVFSGEKPPVALLIPLRNERENLDSLVLELQKLTYPHLEILLIDDQSEDGTFSELSKKMAGDSRVKILKSPGVGKKAAIEFGVGAAQAKLMLCSDADCCFPEFWVERMMAPFVDSKVQLVAGPVMSAGQTSFFERFQQVEWASVLLTTQFFFSLRKPLMCSAANWAYRKSAFREVEGYAGNVQHWSGDDEFLLKKIAAQYGAAACRYLPFRGNLVFTQPQKTLSDLFMQRIRWASKWRLHQDWGHLFSAIFPVFVQLIWLASLGLLWLGKYEFLAFVAVWIGKMVAERLVLGRMLNTLGVRLLLSDFAKTAILHPLYVLTVTVGAVRGKFNWKGRAN